MVVSSMMSYKTAVLLAIVAMAVPLCHALVPWRSPGVRSEKRKTNLQFAMKRPIIDQVASFLFQLETDRVEKSSVVDEKGRLGEPMEWSERESVANKFSEFIASNDVGYAFKQFVADIVAGEFDKDQTGAEIDSFIKDHPVAMFSFSTCPFCRRAKDFLEENAIPYQSLELDDLPGNRGNEIRAMLGRKTRRTSVPSIFIGGQYIGGCNDGPGLLPLAESGQLKLYLDKSRIQTLP
jgi:glutaredoxin 3